MPAIWPAASEPALHLIEQIRASWGRPDERGTPGRASWQPSRLTPDGQPIELAFATGEAGLRLTAEPGPVGSPVAAKRRLIGALAGVDPGDDPLIGLLAGLAGQRFGCWLGLRDRPTGPQLKVYQEVLPGGRAEVLRHLDRAHPGAARIPDLEPRLVGVGLSADAAREYYCHLRDARLSALHRVFALAGLAQWLPSVLARLGQLAGVPPDSVPDHMRLGVSLSGAGLTVFARAHQLFASDRQARRRLLELGDELGAAMAAYGRATESLDRDTGLPMLHGMVGIKVRPGGPLEITVGISPPPSPEAFRVAAPEAVAGVPGELPGLLCGSPSWGRLRA